MRKIDGKTKKKKGEMVERKKDFVFVRKYAED